MYSICYTWQITGKWNEVSEHFNSKLSKLDKEKRANLLSQLRDELEIKTSILKFK